MSSIARLSLPEPTCRSDTARGSGATGTATITEKAPEATAATAACNCATVTASLAATPGATLTMRRLPRVYGASTTTPVMSSLTMAPGLTGAGIIVQVNPARRPPST
jgi:hypothetical protein